jgi:hypothetical protein
VIGWDQARAHLHCFHQPPEWRHPGDGLVEFNPRGSAVAAELAVLLGLDPKTVTAAEMDATDARFVCGVCPPETHGRRRPLTWRDCVRFPVHFGFECIAHICRSQVVHGGSNATPASHGPPSWIVLSPLAAADVRRREEPEDYSDAHVWSCTLCNDYLPSLGYHRDVKEHIVLKCVI